MPQFQIKEREECQGVYLENVLILEVWRMKTGDRRQDVQLRKNYARIFFTNIYIYMRVFLWIKV